MTGSNAWADLATSFRRTCSAHKEHEETKADLKRLVPEDARDASGHGPRAKRSKAGAKAIIQVQEFFVIFDTLIQSGQSRRIMLLREISDASLWQSSAAARQNARSAASWITAKIRNQRHTNARTARLRRLDTFDKHSVQDADLAYIR
jgi:hypothetical protein